MEELRPFFPVRSHVVLLVIHLLRNYAFGLVVTFEAMGTMQCHVNKHVLGSWIVWRGVVHAEQMTVLQNHFIMKSIITLFVTLDEARGLKSQRGWTVPSSFSCRPHCVEWIVPSMAWTVKCQTPAGVAWLGFGTQCSLVCELCNSLMLRCDGIAASVLMRCSG
jgi:hypothetical protein